MGHKKKEESIKRQQKEAQKLKSTTKSKEDIKTEENTDASSENESTKTATTSNTTEIVSSSTSVPIIDEEFVFICNIARKCLENGVAVAATGKNFGNVHAEPPPAIRITLSSIQTKNDIDTVIRVLSNAVNTTVSDYVKSQ